MVQLFCNCPVAGSPECQHFPSFAILSKDVFLVGIRNKALATSEGVVEEFERGMGRHGLLELKQ